MVQTNRIVCVVAALGFCAVIAIGMGGVRTADSARAVRSPGAAAAPDVSPYPSRYLLNALLLPALDPDALPLRWVDPRPALGCGPDSAVRVNGAPLVAGTRVPDRQHWGFSAAVAPSDLRVAWGKNWTTWLEPGTASMPLCVDPTEPDALVPCR